MWFCGLLIGENSWHLPQLYPTGRASEPGRQAQAGRQAGATRHQHAVPVPLPTAMGNSAQVYEVPDTLPRDAGTRKMNDSFDNPEYYSTIQDVHSTTDNSQVSALVSLC